MTRIPSPRRPAPTDLPDVAWTRPSEAGRIDDEIVVTQVMLDAGVNISCIQLWKSYF
jgi:hypothetical protein